MNKLIVKTALITLAVLLAVSSMIYLCFALFAPSKMSEFYDGLGSGELSLHYAECAYKKSGEEGDLLIVVRRAVAAKNSKKTAKYCAVLFEKFPDFVSGEELAYYQYKYCVALCDCGEKDTAVNKAVEFSKYFEPGNPLESLAAYGFEKKDTELLNLMLNDIRLIAESPEVSEANSERAKSRIKIIEDYLGEGNHRGQ